MGWGASGRGEGGGAFLELVGLVSVHLNPPLIREEVSLIFRWDNFKPSENQATKK